MLNLVARPYFSECYFEVNLNTKWCQSLFEVVFELLHRYLLMNLIDGFLNKPGLYELFRNATKFQELIDFVDYFLVKL